MQVNDSLSSIFLFDRWTSGLGLVLLKLYYALVCTIRLHRMQVNRFYAVYGNRKVSPVNKKL